MPRKKSAYSDSSSDASGEDSSDDEHDVSEAAADSEVSRGLRRLIRKRGFETSERNKMPANGILQYLMTVYQDKSAVFDPQADDGKHYAGRVSVGRRTGRSPEWFKKVWAKVLLNKDWYKVLKLTKKEFDSFMHNDDQIEEYLKPARGSMNKRRQEEMLEQFITVMFCNLAHVDDEVDEIRFGEFLNWASYDKHQLHDLADQVRRGMRTKQPGDVFHMLSGTRGGFGVPELQRWMRDHLKHDLTYSEAGTILAYMKPNGVGLVTLEAFQSFVKHATSKRGIDDLFIIDIAITLTPEEELHKQADPDHKNWEEVPTWIDEGKKTGMKVWQLRDKPNGPRNPIVDIVVSQGHRTDYQYSTELISKGYREIKTINTPGKLRESFVGDSQSMSIWTLRASHKSEHKCAILNLQVVTLF